MKKILATMIALAALCNIASAVTPEEAYLVFHHGLDGIQYDNRKVEYLKELPYDTFKQYAVAVLDKATAITNKNDSGMALNKILFDPKFNTFLWVCAEKLNEQDIATIDTRFSEFFKGRRALWNGDTPKFFDEYPYFPKTCEVLFEEYDVDEYRVNMYRYTPRHNEDPSCEYLASKINLALGCKERNFDSLKRTLRNFVLKAARMRLHSRSEGFIVRRDGSNPLQEVFDRVAECINAPHQRGLKEFIEEYAPGYKWIDVEYPSDMDVMVLVGDILNGKKPIDEYRSLLFYTLGAEQYNEFIDRYNDRQQ